MPFFFSPAGLTYRFYLADLATADSLDVRIPLSTLIFIPLLGKIPREIPRVSGGAREREGRVGGGRERASRNDGAPENPS